MIGRVNVGGGGRGAAEAFAYIHVTYTAGAVCTATNGSVTLTAPNTSGGVMFAIQEPSSLPETWTIALTNGVLNRSTQVSITAQYQFDDITLLLSRLPAGYQEVEYLESSGTQYIDTGFAFSSSGANRLTAEFDIVYMTLPNSHNPSLVGGLTNGTEPHYAFPLFRPSGDTAVYAYSASAAYISNFAIGAKYSAVINDANHKIYHDDVELATIDFSTASNPTQTFCLFAARVVGGSETAGYLANARIYSFIVKNNSTNEILKNLVPCYRISDSVAGMIDLVSNTFLTNSGTGTFVVGQDV